MVPGTPLQIAAANGKLGLLLDLLEHGADPYSNGAVVVETGKKDAPFDVLNGTPLEVAIIMSRKRPDMKKHFEMIVEILEHAMAANPESSSNIVPPVEDAAQPADENTYEDLNLSHEQEDSNSDC